MTRCFFNFFQLRYRNFSFHCFNTYFGTRAFLDAGRRAVECRTQIGTVTKTVTVEMTPEEKTQKLLNKMASHMGLEPWPLALKAQIGGF